MKLTRSHLSLAFLLAACVPCLAQQTVNIPVSALVCQGSQTKFKHAVRMNMNMVAEGQTLPMSMRMALVQTSSYGKRQADGLCPVSVTTAVGSFSGSFAGMPVPDARKSLTSIPIPKVTTWYTRTGAVHEVKVSGLPKEVASGGSMWMSGSSLGQFGSLMSGFPTGEVTLGAPITQSIDLPIAPGKMKFQITYVPSSIVTVAGEQAVRFVVEGSSDLDFSGLAIPAARGADMSGTGFVKITGEMAVGMKTGEIIRQSFHPYILFAAGAGGKQVEAEIDMNIDGYRLKG